MKPDRSNYEIWVIDWLDGNLTDEQAEELKVFLNENPDLKVEFEGIAQVNLKSGEYLFSGKEYLQRSIDSLSPSQFEHLCIAWLENDLSNDQRSELLDIVNNDENKKREFELIQRVRLQPLKYSFAGKKRIKKLTAGQKVIRLAAAVLSAAAAILIFIVVFLSSPSEQTINEKQALNAANHDTLTIPANPSIIIKDKEASPSQESVLRQQLKLVVPNIKIPEQENLIAVIRENRQPDTVFRIRRAEAIVTLNIPIPDNIINASIPDPYGLLAYSKYATIPSPFEEDRSNVDRFFARLFHERIMKDKAAGASPVKPYDIAVAGITGLNKLFGWQLALHKNTDENGEVKSYNFSSKLLKFNTPAKKASDSL